MQQSMDIGDEPAPATATGLAWHSRIKASDAVQLSEQTRDWHFEFSQLKRGNFDADGGVLELDGVSLGRLSISHTLLHRGYAPKNMTAVFLPGPGSGPVFAHGQSVESGQCITMAEGCLLEAVTHGYFLDVAFGFDMQACHAQLDSLNGGSLGVARETTVAAPGQRWMDDMLRRVDCLFAAAVEHPQSLGQQQVRASLADHLLAAMVRFDNAPADVDSTTRAARAARRVAVRLARDFIHSRMSEPLRLSELCRHARLKVRSLEYGFREVTGLTPVAYIKSLRLHAVRRVLLHDASAQHRSISEIAMDTGFWHLSQFALDYRRFFGETPTQTRRRGLANRCAPAHTAN